MVGTEITLDGAMQIVLGIFAGCEFFSLFSQFLQLFLQLPQILTQFVNVSKITFRCVFDLCRIEVAGLWTIGHKLVGGDLL